jgi:hypothetical protein
MQQRHLAFLVSSAILIGGALAACGGDSGGPSGVACTGTTPPIPDLAGTWTLDTIEFVGQTAPMDTSEATGSFVFTGDRVNVTLNILSPPTALIGSGKCTLTATKLYISDGTGLIGNATGTYRFGEGGAEADTLNASLLSSGQTIRVVVTR